MKKTLNKGSSILEVLIAVAILTLGISAASMLAFGNQSLKLDSETSNEALYKAKTILENARANGKNDFNSVNSVSFPSDGTIYSKKMDVVDITLCRKEITSNISWSTEILRPQTVNLKTNITDVPGYFKFGSDCQTEAPSDWDNPKEFAKDTFSEKSTALDVLKKIAYLGIDKKPFLTIGDTNGVVLGQNGGIFVTFTNNFNSDGKTIDLINDIDVFEETSTGKVYALLAMASSTAQFAVLDVTDIQKPELKALRRLNGVTATDMTSHGYRIYYYDKKAYIVTRETAGPEFHIFDLANPPSPVEFGSGTALIGPTPPNGTTVNDLVVRDGIAYMAAEKELAELLVYDVSNPSFPTHVSGATVNLPGSQNGTSIYLIGNKVFFGRENTGGEPELYVFDATKPFPLVGGLPILGSKEIGAEITNIRVSAHIGFLAINKPSNELQIWNISQPSNIVPIKIDFNFGNKIINGGLEYEYDYLYAIGNVTSNFQMLYNKP